MTPALQLNPHKDKRNRFSRSNMLHKDRGQQLIKKLRAHQRDYPRFKPYLEQIISKVLADSHRTRKGDREKVLTCLRNWGGLSQQEIMEDTGLSRWDVRQILYELLDKGLVREERPQGATSRPQWSRSVYWLIN